MEIKKLAFDQVEVVEAQRIRPIDTEKLARLVASMGDVGQMSPIEVIEIEGKPGAYRLVAGYHRLRAAQDKLSGLDGINAVVYRGASDENTIKLREIDENLARADLSHYDRANFIAQRAIIWEAKNGKIKQGPKNYRQVGGNSMDARNVRTFNAEVCEKFGLSRREVERHRTRLRNILPPVWAALRGTAIIHNGTQLDQIAGLGEEQQNALADLLFGDQRLKFSDAMKSLRGARAEPSPSAISEEAKALLKLWRATSAEGRRIFICGASKRAIMKIIDKEA